MIKKEDFFDNVYVLSMVGCSTLVDKFKELFPEFKRYTVFWGLNTKDTIQSIHFLENIDLPQDILRYSNMHPGVIGCHMNHFYAIYSALISGQKFAVFMEDDCFPVNDIEYLTESMGELPENWECINFGWIPSIVLEERRRVPVDYSEHFYKNTGMECSGAFGYILNIEGMKKALSVLSDIRIPSDMIFKFLNTFYLKKPLVGHPPAYAPSRIR